MANIAEILVGLEKRIMVLERLANIQPEAATLVHPKSEKQAEFRIAETVRIAKEAAETEITKEVIK